MDKRIKKAHTLIRKNFKEPILLDSLSRKVGLSKFHLQRLFKEEFGESPASFLNRIRLEYARHFLKLKSPHSMSELASECGFSSPAVFSRSFTRFFGIPPTLMKDRFVDDPPVLENSINVRIVELPEMYLFYEATEMYAPDLQSSFEFAREKAISFGLRPSNRLIGLLNHLNVHTQEKKLNYLAGVELMDKVPHQFKEEVFFVPSGKYASFTTQYSRGSFMRELIELKYNWLDKSDFSVKELFAMEEFGEDFSTQRTIYLPLMKKSG